jgi:hypothetical protein
MDIDREIDKIRTYHANRDPDELQAEREQQQRGIDNRTSGHAFDRRILLAEKRNSILAVNSLGSLGLIDTVSIRKNYVLLITNKENGYLDPRERRRLDKLKVRLPKFCKIQLRYRRGRKIKKMWY